MSTQRAEASDPVTGPRAELRAGDPAVWNEIVPLMYAQLRRVAARQLRRAGLGNTFTPTALVHEAYLRLQPQAAGRFNDRAHFLAVGALIMRRILVSDVRARSARKRGVALRLQTLDEDRIAGSLVADEVVEMDDLLARLETVSERQARAVTMRVFGGLTDDEIACVLGVSTPTVRRDWRVARAWLIKELGHAQG
jgi:RNA polymerase sigma factor (TIGR02999 family)